MAHQNPFDPPQPLDSNPFADSSRPGGSNPFQHANDSAFSLESADTERAPGAGGQTTNATGYGFATGASQAEAGRAGRSQRSIDLERRERELREREETLRSREAAVGAKENNWPPCKSSSHNMDASVVEPGMEDERGSGLTWESWRLDSNRGMQNFLADPSSLPVPTPRHHPPSVSALDRWKVPVYAMARTRRNSHPEPGWMYPATHLGRGGRRVG
jgi:hypothetical protein